MPDLIALAELKTHLGVTTNTDDTAMTFVLDRVESALEKAAGRAAVPFKAAAGADITEVYDGSGSTRLYLNYPVLSLTSVKLGRKPSTPDETLDVTDADVLVFNGRELARTDGRQFGIYRSPRYVQVVYKNAADLPEDAKLAVLQVAAAIWRQRGTEGSSSMRLPDFDAAYKDAIGATPEWAAAIESNARYAIV